MGFIDCSLKISRNQKCRILQQEKRKLFPHVGFVIGIAVYLICVVVIWLLRGSDIHDLSCHGPARSFYKNLPSLESRYPNNLQNLRTGIQTQTQTEHRSLPPLPLNGQIPHVFCTTAGYHEAIPHGLCHGLLIKSSGDHQCHHLRWGFHQQRSLSGIITKIAGTKLYVTNAATRLQVTFLIFLDSRPVFRVNPAADHRLDQWPQHGQEPRNIGGTDSRYFEGLYIYISGLIFRESPHNSYGQTYGTFTYLHSWSSKSPIEKHWGFKHSF